MVATHAMMHIDLRCLQLCIDLGLAADMIAVCPCRPYSKVNRLVPL